MSLPTVHPNIQVQTWPKAAWLGAWIDFCRRCVRKFCHFSIFTPAMTQSQIPYQRIEDYPSGYPRFSGLIGAHSAFSLCRRFSVVRARLLLVKQDRVCVLEKQLEELDEKEQRPLFLGACRQDRNVERKIVLEELDRALADYDALVERNARMLQLPTATKRNISSLLNWVEGTRSICRKEVRFLHERDLCIAESSTDHGLAAIESFVERISVRLCEYFQKTPNSSISRDRRVFIFTGAALKILACVLITWLIVMLLLVPVVAMNAINRVPLQIFCVMVASSLFILILSGGMKARTTEVFIASATYAALLVIFISGNKCGT